MVAGGIEKHTYMKSDLERIDAEFVSDSFQVRRPVHHGNRVPKADQVLLPAPATHTDVCIK
jgi:hypothetical protein